MLVYRRYNWHEIWPVAFCSLVSRDLHPPFEVASPPEAPKLEVTGTTWCRVVKICQNWVKIQLGSPKLKVGQILNMTWSKSFRPPKDGFFLLIHRQIISQILYHFTRVKLSCGSPGGHVCTWLITSSIIMSPGPFSCSQMYRFNTKQSGFCSLFRRGKGIGFLQISEDLTSYTLFIAGQIPMFLDDGLETSPCCVPGSQCGVFVQ